MGVITVKHFHASKLPKELRGEFPDDALVSVTIEEEKENQTASTPTALKIQIDRVRKTLKRPVTMEEAVDRVRKLRDEWDD